MNFSTFAEDIAVGVTRSYRVSGNFVFIDRATAKLAIAFGGDDRFVQFPQGCIIRRPFRSFQVLNLDAVETLTVNLVAGSGIFVAPWRDTDDRQLFAVITADASVPAHSQLNVYSPGTGRFGTWLGVPAGQPGPLRIGDGTVSNNNGVLLHPGTAMFTYACNRIRAFNDNGAAVKICRMKE